MSGILWLDWATLAVSFFDTSILIWLGFTVLLNAERRNWGVWLAAGGLFTGAAFFVSHSAILGQRLLTTTRGLNFWWHAGWGPVVLAPYAWYVLMLWYTGYWEDTRSALYRRHTFWLGITVIFTLALAGLLLFGNPLPTLALGAQFNFDTGPTLLGAPLLMIAYPVYILLCIILALDALLHPAPSHRLFGEAARRRARPWLVGATLVLLVVSLLVGGVLYFVIRATRISSDLIELYNRSILYLAGFDLFIAALIGAAVLMLGRAIVAYEIFAGRTLPRRALLRDYRRAVILCGGISLLFAGALTLQIRPIYMLLLAAGLMVTFYALITWRSFADRDSAMRQLRPFAASQGLYGKLLSDQRSQRNESDPEALFAVLIQDVLNANRATLVPLGPLAGLTHALTVPSGAEFHVPTLEEVQAHFPTPQTMLITSDQPGEWLIPLWNEEGLAGALLLAEKVDGGFYSQEEIEIARASGERLLDTCATAEMTRRLVALERDRMTKSAVLDQRTRRVLHDDVLPRLHTALLKWSAQPDAQTPEGQQSLDLLAGAHREIAALLRDMPPAAAPELAKLGVVGALRQTLESELADEFDAVHWEVDPAAVQGLEDLPDLNAEVLFYAAREAMRNAARHGRGSENAARPLHLDVRMFGEGDHWIITVEDDGVGMDAASTENSGSGQGLTLHSTLMAVVGGSLAWESEPNRFTRVSLKIPRSRPPEDSKR